MDVDLEDMVGFLLNPSQQPPPFNFTGQSHRPPVVTAGLPVMGGVGQGPLSVVNSYGIASNVGFLPHLPFYFQSAMVHLPSDQDQEDHTDPSTLQVYPTEDTFRSSGDTSAGGGSSAGGGLGKAERNRNAQKRFRERQKVKLSHLEQEYAQISKHYETLAAENEKLKLKTDSLDKMLLCREEHLVILRKDAKGIFHPSIAQIPDRVEGTCQGALYDSVGATSTEVFRRMTPEEFMERWKDYLKEVSGWLLKAETQPDPDPIVLSNIGELVGCAGWMCKHFTVLNQPSANIVLSYNLEERCVEVPDDSHWGRVLQALQLTTEQRRDALGARELFLASNQKIMSERERLVAAVQTTTDKSVGGIDTQLAQGKVVSDDLARRLSDNLIKQHTSTMGLNFAFLDKICTPLQFARASMYSYPFLPDALALVNIIAQEEQAGTKQSV